MTKLMTFVIAGALFAVMGCAPAAPAAGANTTPAATMPAADAGAAQPTGTPPPAQ